MLLEPLGFRVDYNAAVSTYDYNLETSLRSHRSKLAKLPENLLGSDPFPGTTVFAGSGDTYVINDAGGSGFKFGHYRSPSGYEDGLISVDEAERLSGWSLSRPLNGETFALSCRTFTDIMLIRHVSGTELNVAFDIEARQSAWTSFAELLLSAATDLLMVERRELEVGIRRSLRGGELQAEIFLADALENGAGYVVELARATRFRELMENILDGGLADRFAAHQCDSACYLCLKNYGNMRSHGILDWRLALDLANVIAGRPLPDRAAHSFDSAAYFCEANNASGYWPEEHKWTMSERNGFPILSGPHGLIAVVPPLMATQALPAFINDVGHRTSTCALIRRPLDVALTLPSRVQSLNRAVVGMI